jgi:hypothetical protein
MTYIKQYSNSKKKKIQTPIAPLIKTNQQLPPTILNKNQSLSTKILTMINKISSYPITIVLFQTQEQSNLINTFIPNHIFSLISIQKVHQKKINIVKNKSNVSIKNTLILLTKNKLTNMIIYQIAISFVDQIM